MVPQSSHGRKHTVRLEPVGIEIEVDEDETILNAAFRQGVMLMHGCKEGQCAACKSFLLDGEVDLDRYSTFALPDFEEEEGYTLLCRAHALSDVEIELLHYDEEVLRSGVPTSRRPEVRPSSRSPTTSAARAQAARPGQPHVPRGPVHGHRDPGRRREHRSFSMANTPGEPGRLEFMIKLYEGGHFSGLLANGTASRSATS